MDEQSLLVPASVLESTPSRRDGVSAKLEVSGGNGHLKMRLVQQVAVLVYVCRLLCNLIRIYSSFFGGFIGAPLRGFHLSGSRTHAFFEKIQNPCSRLLFPGKLL